MKNSVKESILGNIQEIKALGYRKLIVEAIPAAELASGTVFEDITYSRMIDLLDRSLMQIESMLNTEDGVLLPDSFHLHEIDGVNAPSTISTRIDQAKSYVTARQWPQLGSVVAWLVAYQMAYGFWNESEKKVHHVDEIKIKKQKAEVDVLLDTTKRLRDDLEQSATSVITIKQTQSESVSALVSELTLRKGQLDETLGSAKGIIDGIQQLGQTTIEEIKSQKEESASMLGDMHGKRESVVVALAEIEQRQQSANNIYSQLDQLLASATGLAIENEGKAKGIEEFRLMAEHGLSVIREAQNSANAGLQSIQAVMTELDQFYQNKQRELQTITNSLETVNAQRDQVNQHASKASELFGELKSKTEESNKTLDAIKMRQQEEATSFDTLKLSTQEMLANTESKQQQTQAALDKAVLLHKEILEKRDLLLKTLGLATDSSLSQHFSNRQEKLSTKLKWWTVFVPITGIAAIVWAIIVFVYLKADGTNLYLNLGVNVFKTLPAFILLAFVLRQYSRERLVEEEYAFRAVISSTINTYSELLEDKEPIDPTKKNEASERVQMLREVLKQIYALPRLYPERRPSILRVRSRDLSEVLKQFNEATKAK